MTDIELMKTPYAEFVNGLFIKPVDLPGKLMHASIGILGEAIELMFATSRENEVEELGDLEFYFQAFFNNCPATPGFVIEDKLLKAADLMSATQSAKQLVYWSNELLDSCKKVWVYGKPIEAINFLLITANIRRAIEYYYKWSGITYEIAVEYNRIKLIKRYPGATYTDQAAIARADKQGEQA